MTAPAPDKRQRIPKRRPQVIFEIEYAVGAGVGVQTLEVAAGVDVRRERVAEVFINGPKIGSDLEATCNDAAVLASIALQMGAEPAALAHSLSDGSPIGLALAHIAADGPAIVADAIGVQAQ